MANTLDPSTVEIYAYGTRICRSCGYELPVDPERAADHWYITKAGRLSAYCKVCTKKKVVECRRDRQAGVKHKRFKCSVCGCVRNVDWDGDTPVCQVCDVAYRVADGDLKVALETLAWIHGHTKDVEERRARHNNNRAFLPHPEWIYGKYPYQDHRDCIKAEVSARAVVRFLASNKSRID